MNTMILEKEVRNLIARGKLQEAEQRVLAARDEASRRSDAETVPVLLDLLVEVYSLQEPRDIAKADAVCLEREVLVPTAYSKLQTAMMRYWAGHDYLGTIAKANDAIASGTAEGDDSTVYTALSLLGLSRISTGDHAGAEDALRRIEQMLEEKRRIVVGDETPFLEAAQSSGLNPSLIAKIAGKLAPVCRDVEFAKRLSDLAKIV